ncbi:RHS repeat domain-containing protein [Paenibacillus durus]|uniref:RHS repeat-associated core domain-containing protein n=1 Tax=Paenibacillus durus TaxID=44251 RepID=A0A089HTZ1_PAEDU|nr:RHS repeat-associated core domain-containing protein [Paenibacillus durus]AIQ14547.1 hypothetical protein PDUR_23640 [Paenibacillus durus]
MQDALGSTLGLVEKDGRVSSRYHYDEFGVPQDAKKFDLNWPGPDNLFGYTGLGYDFASSNTYARARYYEPKIGRFISEDTYRGQIDDPQSLNLYAYALNNSINRIDPSGHDSYVFYEPKDWSGQAESEAARLTALYGTPVHLTAISNTKGFENGWNSMGGYDANGKEIKIEGVSLLFHGHPTTKK